MSFLWGYCLYLCAMLYDLIKNKQLILASKSPRRKELLSAMNLDFEIIVRPVDEQFPPGLKPHEAAEHIALSKAEVFRKDLKTNQIILTGDTIVACDDLIMGKPKNREDAIFMLNKLSGRPHQVTSSICLLYNSETVVKSDTARVHFKKLSAQEIDFYIKNYKPYDKAGAYGIQEWLGHIGILKLEGSYNTVMGLPTHLLYNMLQNLPVNF